MSRFAHASSCDGIAQMALRVVCFLALTLICQADPQQSVPPEQAGATEQAGVDDSSVMDFEPLPRVLPTRTNSEASSKINWEIPQARIAPGQVGSVLSATSGPIVAYLQSSNMSAHLSPRQKLEKDKLFLEQARYYRNLRRTAEAVPILIDLLNDDTPDGIRKTALLELAAAAQEENELSRAQQIYAQFLYKWPEDPRVPEVLLRQGRLFRQMGLNGLALTKFYAVMTSALVLKNDRLDYYAHVVLESQVEIAETHYLLGKYTEASDFLTRLLKQNNPALDKALILYKLMRCQSTVSNYDGAVATGQDYLVRYPNGSEQPEVRFHLALALKQLGRNNESLQQVLTLLREQSANAAEHPEVWAYWQQRTGNLIANQLFREGDYTRALDIYLGLAQLDNSPAWQLPVQYQIGLTYERLWQPQMAIDTYNGIIKREPELTPNSPPSLRSIVDMARWRINHVQWQGRAEVANREARQSAATGISPSDIATP